MQIQLSDHFTYRKLLRFVISPVLMMVFTSLYTVVDGFFVSNYVGKTAFAAVNLMMPVLIGVSTIGIMLGSGGSAVVAKTLGEGKNEQARQYFSMLVYAAAVLGILFAVLGIWLAGPIAGLLKAEGQLLEDCTVYGKILFFAQPFYILQNIFLVFFVTAQKPDLSLRVSLAAGLTNTILDYLFIAVWDGGIEGAGWASALGMVAGAVIPLIYFACPNGSLLRLGKSRLYGSVLLKSISNGSSEMVMTLSASVVGVLYNLQLMKMLGENGVAAYGIIMYVNFVFTAIFFGYGMGSGPLIAYHYGAQNYEELKNLFKKSLKLVAVTCIILVISAEILAWPLVYIFASYDTELFELTLHGFRIFSLAFLLMGINMWGSAFFTALNNGLISASISFVRTMIFETSTVMILPYFLKIDGIWMAVLVAEILAVCMTVFFFLKKKNQYHYL